MHIEKCNGMVYGFLEGFSQTLVFFDPLGKPEHTYSAEVDWLPAIKVGETVNFERFQSTQKMASISVKHVLRGPNFLNTLKNTRHYLLLVSLLVLISATIYRADSQILLMSWQQLTDQREIEVEQGNQLNEQSLMVGDKLVIKGYRQCLLGESAEQYCQQFRLLNSAPLTLTSLQMDAETKQLLLFLDNYHLKIFKPPMSSVQYLSTHKDYKRNTGHTLGKSTRAYHAVHVKKIAQRIDLVCKSENNIAECSNLKSQLLILWAKITTSNEHNASPSEQWKAILAQGKIKMHALWGADSPHVYGRGEDFAEFDQSVNDFMEALKARLLSKLIGPINLDTTLL